MTSLRSYCGDLLQQILTSRHFAHAGTLKRVLVYLHERSRDSQLRPPKEYEIAVEAMGRPPEFDPQLDPVVRVTVSQIRKRLAAFFSSEGAALPWRLEIPPGRYVTVIRANEKAPAGHPRSGCLQEFWGEHWRSSQVTLILYTEPLFYTDHHGLFVRHWLINDAARREELHQKAPGLGGIELEPAYHYLSAGEMRCLLSLSRCLTTLGVAADFRNCRHCQRTELLRHHAILLGSPRTNPFLEEMQRGLPLRASADSIELWQEGRRARRWRDGPTRRGGDRHLRCWAVLSRFRNPQSGSVVLMIASNHGAAIEGTGHALTLEETVDELLQRLGARQAGILPPFQVLMEVTANELDGEILDVRFRHMLVLKESAGRSATASAGRS
jgi:hypothetical protein